MTDTSSRLNARRLAGSSAAIALAVALASPQAAWAQDATPASPQESGAAATSDLNAPVTAAAAGVSAQNEQDTPAVAQEAGEGGQEIVVTGFREALRSALSIKKQSAGVVDAINAQDIADFPDTNLADSLQRIPGISIEREAGEGRQITVRGLGGDFSRTRFNGLEAISATTGSTLGAGINRGRSFDYSVFASELFNSLVVRKTQSAEVDEGSLGATVDLRTGRPFDNPGFTGALSGQVAYYDINKHYAPRLAGLISNTWMDDRIGLLVSAAYNKRTVQEDAYSNTALSDFSDINNGFCPVNPLQPTTTPVNPLVGTAPRATQCTPMAGAVPGSTQAAYDAVNRAGVFVPRLPGYGRFLNKQERLGLTATFQAKPSDSTLITLDGAYSRYKQNRTDLATNPISLNRGLGTTQPAGTSPFTAAQLSGRPNMKIREAQVDANGQLVYGVFDDVDFALANSLDISTTEFYQVNAQLEQEFGERAKLTILGGQSKSVFDNPYSRLVNLSRFDSDGFIYDARDDRKRPKLVYGFDAANPNSWQFAQGYDTIRMFRGKVTNQLDTIKADFRFELNDALTLKAGAAYKRFKFISVREQRIAATTLIPTLASGGLTIADATTGPITIDTIGLPAGSSNSFVVPNLRRILDAFDVDCECVNQYGDFRMGSVGTGSQGDNRDVTEKDFSPYIQADFNFDLANGMTVRGDVGVRYAHTKQRSRGFVGAGTLVTANRSYDYWLPAANVAVDLTPELTARFAAAKVISRPSLPQLTPGGAIGTAQTPYTATVGNPNLKPFEGTNYDAALEWYFARGAALTAAFFYKKVGSFVQQVTTTTGYSDAGLPLSLLPAGADPNATTNITSFQNTKGGDIKGIELSYQQPFTFLPGFLSNFGVIANYTYIKSKISYILTTNAAGPSLVAPLINVSPHAANGTLYYEDKKFSARVSVAFRDEYVRQVPLRAGLADYTGAYSTLNVDASTSYQLTENVTISADAINLTNQATDFWNGVSRRDQQVFSKTGRQFFLGARIKI